MAIRPAGKSPPARPDAARSAGPKVKPVGRKRGRSRIAVVRGQHRVDPFRRLALLANVEQATHDVANHVVQELIGLKLKTPVGRAPGNSDASMFLTGDKAWQALARNEVKSCSPTSWRAACCMGSSCKGRYTSPPGPDPDWGAPATAAPRKRIGATPRWRGNEMTLAQRQPIARRCRAATRRWGRAPRRYPGGPAACQSAPPASGHGHRRRCARHTGWRPGGWQNVPGPFQAGPAPSAARAGFANPGSGRRGS